jgi:hypothetical protein
MADPALSEMALEAVLGHPDGAVGNADLVKAPSCAESPHRPLADVEPFRGFSAV